jgi:PmbA protein
MDLSPQAETVARLLRGRQLDGYEIMVSQSRDLSIEVKGGKLDAFRCAEPFGVAVRVQRGSGLGFSFSTTLDPAALARMVDGAVVAAEMQTPDPCSVLPAASPAPCPQLPGLYDAALAGIPEKDKIARTLELERLVLSRDPRLRRVRKCSYGESVYALAISNSHGLNAGYRGSQLSFSVSAVAESEGDAQIGWDFGFAHSYAGIDLARIADGACRKATALLGARGIPTMRCRAVLDNRVAGQLLEVLAPSFLAENVQKGKSLLAGRTGERLFPPLLTIRDNGLLAGGIGSAPCDGEGVAQQDTRLVCDGVLEGFLYDSYWGRRSGCPSTGNAVRGGVKGPPRLGVHNLFIEPGTCSPEALRAGISRGVLITEVMGVHSANPISGDFSVGAAGFYLEGGEIAHPVKGIAIAGNLLDLFGGTDLIADDLRFFGSVGSPALRIGELDVSGS